MLGGRDPKGRFVKGHPPFYAHDGVKPGRKKKPENEVLDLLGEIGPWAFLKLYELCIAGNERACEYLIDRQYGKPTVPLDHGIDEGLETLIEGLAANRMT